MQILLTGGLGYIGSHTTTLLLNANITPIIIDNLSNSTIDVLDNIKTITNKEPIFYQGDLKDLKLLNKVFKNHPKINAVIHLAGSKIMTESLKKPLEYYNNNLSSTLTLLEAMQRANIKNLIFSSSAAVYDPCNKMPVSEDMPTGNLKNPYARSKLMIEQIMQDISSNDPDFNITILRYFNPIGAHPSSLLGENSPNGANNLMGLLTKVATGTIDQFNIYGDKHLTADGTCLRDYIHIMDLAAGHLKALKHLLDKGGLHVFNLGTGAPQSVLVMLHSMEKIIGKKINYKICQNRDGEVASCWADVSLAKNKLNWEAKLSLTSMLTDSLNWEIENNKE